MNGIQLIIADSGSDLQRKVDAELKKGWDLYGPLVTGHRLALGQWMVQTYPYHEYKLVEAMTFTELEQSVRQFEAEGFDFFQFTADWSGIMYQWMCRAVERELRYTTAAAIPHYTVVTRVEPTLRLIPNILAGAPPLVVEDGHDGFESPSET